MTDTPEHIALEYRKRLMALSPATRIAMACDMFGTAKALARANLIQVGVTDEREIRRQLFLRFYGSEFSESQKAKILAHL